MRLYVEGLAAALAEAGLDVTVLSRSGAEYEGSGFRVLRDLRDPGRPVSRAVWALDRTLTSLLNGAARNRECRRGYDLCHIHLMAPPIDRFLMRGTRIPTVITVHDVRPHEQRWWEVGSSFQSIYSRAAGLIVHSKHNAQALLDRYDLDPGKVAVVPHGFQPTSDSERIPQGEARSHLGLPSDVPLALALGSIRADKGLDTALRALRAIPDWHLVVAGSGPEAPRLRELAREMDLDDRIHWRIEFIPDELVGTYFRAADIVLLPYKPSFESQSGVLFQAYRYHVPVVVTDVGSLGDTVRQDGAGLVVPPDSPGLLADAFGPALDLQPDIAWKDLERRYSWTQVAKRTVALYQEIVTSD